jgi:hypothetical protein
MITPFRAAALAAALVGTALAATAGMANSAASSVQCGIVTTSNQGMLELEGAIVSPMALSGEFRLALKSFGNGGSSNISQGGYFSVEANQPTTISKVVINANSSYDLDFDVIADGKKLVCDQDIASLR